MRLAWIGTGAMGSAMAGNVLRAGHKVTVYNRTRQHAEPLAKEGATIANSPAEAAREAEAVVTMLADDRAVEQVVFGTGDAPGFLETLPRGAIHDGMSTVSVDLARKLTDAHSAHGQGYISAPVFGRPSAAAERKLWIVTAGPSDHVERCGPIFEALGRGRSNVGAEPWMANVVKLAGNFMIAAALESMGEAFALVRKSGVDAAQFLEIIHTALFNSPLYANYGGIVAKEQFEPAGFKLRLGFKDLRLVQEAAASGAVPMPVAGVLRDHFLAALARGEGDLDWAAVARIAAVEAGL